MKAYTFGEISEVRGQLINFRDLLLPEHRVIEDCIDALNHAIDMLDVLIPPGIHEWSSEPAEWPTDEFEAINAEMPIGSGELGGEYHDPDDDPLPGSFRAWVTSRLGASHGK